MLARLLLLPILWPILWLLGSAVPAAAQEDHAPAEPANELLQLVTRDTRIAFTPESARRARAFLEAGSDEARPTIEARAVALMALGCGRAGGDAASLESAFAKGSPPERRAAAFALGLLGAEGLPALQRALAGDAAGNEAALCFALLLCERAGVHEALELLESLAATEGSDDRAHAARLVVAHQNGEDARELVSTQEHYYELRWRAARSYGLVDGQRGQQITSAALFADQEFLDRVVLSGVGVLAPAALMPHLVEMLRAGECVGALRAAVRLMPDELARAHQAGTWKPTLETWRVLLDEIDAQRNEKQALALLGMAYRADPALEDQAGVLLVRADADLPWSWIAERFEHGPPELRARLAEACGERGERARIPELAELQQRNDPATEGELLVALARLGHPPAQAAMEEFADAPASDARDRALTALAHVLHEKKLWGLGERALHAEELPLALRLELEIGLALGGAGSSHANLRAALPKALKHPRRLDCVRALGRSPETADLEVLAGLFPVEGDLDLDVELALALVVARHPSTAGVARAALWSESTTATRWNRSVLAGGLVVHVLGVQGLIDELEVAPRTASERDLRRVGFSIGEWGGLGAVEVLGRTRGEGDAALQGALLGALASRAGDDISSMGTRTKIKVEFAPLPRGADAGAALGGKGKGGGGGWGGAPGGAKGGGKGKGKGRGGRG